MKHIPLESYDKKAAIILTGRGLSNKEFDCILQVHVVISSYASLYIIILIQSTFNQNIGIQWNSNQIIYNLT